MTALVRYHGGKVRLADRIVSLFPDHDCYCEPFGGGAAVLLAKPRARLEVYNDLDGDMVTLFRVLRDRAADLAEAIALTPFAREEHEQAYMATEDELERARRVLIRSHFGHGSSGIHRPTGFRAAGLRAGTLPVHGWASLPRTIRQAAERFRGVVIERRPAVQVMRAHDGAKTVFHVDPPYLPETRDCGRDYRHEMTRADHIQLLECLRTLEGSVVLSGYASPMYDEALQDWRRITIKTKADRAGDRTEVLWCNFADGLPLMRSAAGAEDGK
jgi:DNA adenine methylase